MSFTRVSASLYIADALGSRRGVVRLVRPNLAQPRLRFVPQGDGLFVRVKEPPNLIGHPWLSVPPGHEHRQPADISHLKTGDGGADREAAQRRLPDLRGKKAEENVWILYRTSTPEAGHYEA